MKIWTKDNHSDCYYLQENEAGIQHKLHICETIKPSLGKVRDTDTLFLMTGVASGAGFKGDVISSLNNVEHIVTVNGMGAKSLNELRERLSGKEIIWCLHIDDIDPLNTIEQLTWLRKSTQSFAVHANDMFILMLAASFGAEHLIVDHPDKIDFDRIQVVPNLNPQDFDRPISAKESDEAEEKLYSIVAARDLRKGDVITSPDLGVQRVSPRGLSPHLQEALLSRQLRYDISKGERLTFGLIGENQRD